MDACPASLTAWPLSEAATQSAPTQPRSLNPVFLSHAVAEAFLMNGGQACDSQCSRHPPEELNPA